MNLPMADDTPQLLAAEILAGNRQPSEAIGREDAYDALNAGANGRKPFLGGSMKIDATQNVGVLTRVLYMMPANSSGREACAGRSNGCTAACLVDTGRMGMISATEARRRRHASFFANRERFLADLCDEIAELSAQAARKGMRPAVRLNGTTDLPWERFPVTWRNASYPNIMAAFPAIQFYDYTKLALRHRTRNGREALPANYHLTFSMSERKDADSRAIPYLDAGYSVAVVFAAKKGSLPIRWRGRTVIDGDKNDARFTDPAGVYVGLSAKGRAKSDTSGFVKPVV